MRSGGSAEHSPTGRGARARLAGEIWSADPSLAVDERRSAALLTSILSSPTDYSLVVTDTRGLITLWSRGAASVFGYEAPAVVGKLTWWDLGDGEPRPPAPLDDALREGSWSGVVTRVRLSGEHFPARIVVTPLRDDAGLHTGFLALTRDVSAEIRQVAALEDARRAARSIFDANAAPLVVTDLLGVITDVNRPAEALAGISREEGVGANIVSFATEPERARRTLAAVLREGEVAGQEFTLRRPDGGEVSVLLSGSTLRGEDGKLRGLLATIMDLTGQHRLREELRRSQAYCGDIIAAAADGLAVVDGEGMIRDVTPQVCALTGYERDELVGSSFPDCFCDSASARDLVGRALAGEAASAELRLVTSADAVKRVDARLSLMREAGRDGARVVASLRNVTEQAALRDRLARERGYNRSIIESSANGLAITDLSDTITDVNGTMCRLTGRSRADLVGADLLACFADPRAAAGVIHRAHSAGGVAGAELPLAGADEVPSLVNVTVLRGAGAEAEGLLVSVRDISEQVELRRRLAAQEAYARTIVESSFVALFIIAEDDVVADANEEACKLTGLSRKRLVGRKFSSLFADPAGALAGVRAAFREGHVTGHEMTLARTGVAPGPVVALNAGTFVDPRGGGRFLISAVPDVTREKAVEEELRLYTQSLYGATMDAMAITDPMGTITDVNQRMEALTGRPRAELLGAAIETCFTDPSRAHDFVNAVIREGRVADVELTVRRQDGTSTVLWYSAATFADLDGKMRGIFFSARDITERKRFENMQASLLERARELDQAKSEFVSRVSHELRSPLTSVLGYIELLASKDPGPLTPEQERMLEVIDRNGHRLLGLIEDLLLLSRIEAGPAPPARERVDVGALIRAVHESFLPAVRQGQLHCEVDAAPGVELEGDPGQLERVLANLLSNAVKFTPPGGRIRIGARTAGDQVLIEVSDTGIGVPEEEQPHLFGRFFRSSLSAERETQGTGLGLHIVKHVVEAHGGAVGVTSAPGAGSTFTVRLPARRAPRAGGQASTRDEERT